MQPHSASSSGCRILQDTGRLPPGCLVSSKEPKAWETLDFKKTPKKRQHAYTVPHCLIMAIQEGSLEAGSIHLTDGETEAKSLRSIECVTTQPRVYFYMSLDTTGQPLLHLQTGRQWEPPFFTLSEMSQTTGKNTPVLPSADPESPREQQGGKDRTSSTSVQAWCLCKHGKAEGAIYCFHLILCAGQSSLRNSLQR